MQQLTLQDILLKTQNGQYITTYTDPFIKTLNDVILGFKNRNISLTSNDIILNIKDITQRGNGFLGQCPGIFIEQYIIQEISKSIIPTLCKIIHNKTNKTFDYSFINNSTNKNYSIECKSARKSSNAKITKNQKNRVINDSDYILDETFEILDGSTHIIYVKYDIHYNISKTQSTIVFNINDICLMPTQLAGTQTDRVSRVNYDNISKEYKDNYQKSSIYEKLTLKQSLSSIDLFCKQNINESKNHIMLKKFIETYFNKKGDYLYPKSGDTKCKFHAEYDKGLLKFFAENGITEIYSIYDNHTPSLGFSSDEQKWYGWSHRAIYGFGIGDSMKKGTCGFEIYKKTAKAKTLDDAKEMAKAFAKSVG